MNEKTIRWILLVPGTIIISLFGPTIYGYIMGIIIQFIDVPFYPKGQFVTGFLFVIPAFIAPSYVFRVATINASLSIIGCLAFLFGFWTGESTIDLIWSISGSLLALFLVYKVEEESEKGNITQ